MSLPRTSPLRKSLCGHYVPAENVSMKDVPVKDVPMEDNMFSTGMPLAGTPCPKSDVLGQTSTSRTFMSVSTSAPSYGRIPVQPHPIWDSTDWVWCLSWLAHSTMIQLGWGFPLVITLSLSLPALFMYQLYWGGTFHVISNYFYHFDSAKHKGHNVPACFHIYATFAAICVLTPFNKKIAGCFYSWWSFP